MFGITPITGQGEYYINLAAEDYYLEGGEPPGQWLGRGGEELGVGGQVEKEEFRKLLAGFSLADEKLVQNAGKETRRPGWDLTFSAPKSVSVLWSQAGQETRAAIQRIQAQAVEKALNYLEDEAAWTRTGHDGAEWERAKLLVAAFEHGTSRAQDPQLHTHCILMNVGVRDDGQTSTLETRPMYLHQHQADAIYRAELAAGIERELGYRVKRVKSWFEVEGIPESLLGEFSKRREDILEALRKREAKGLPGGVESAAAREKAALSTREKKDHVARAVLFDEWRRVGEDHGFSLGSLPRLRPEERFVDKRQLEKIQVDVIERSVEAATRERTTFTERDLVRAAAQESLGSGLASDQVRDAVASYLGGELPGCKKELSPVSLGADRRDEIRYTTRELYDLEMRMLERNELSQKSKTHTLTTKTLSAVEASRTLSSEQAEAIHWVTDRPGTIKVISGMAGTGKTYALNALREAYEREGYTVIGAALAGKAASGLEEGSGIRSSTVHEFLAEVEKGGFQHRITRLQIAASKSDKQRSFLSYQRDRCRFDLTNKSVVVVDEAAMVSNRQMASLIEETQKRGALLVLVGDAKQLQAIEHGGAFHGIEKRIGSARLTEIRRQTGDDATWQKEAIHQFAAGDAEGALRAYTERGHLTVTNTRRQAVQSAVDDWHREGGAERPSEHLLITGRRLESRLLNTRAQAVRQNEGLLGPDYVEVGDQKLYAGDRVLFTRNNRTLGVENGNLGLIEKVRNGDFIVRLDKGKTTRIDLKHYSDVELGYAITTHKGQGVTVERNAYVLAGGPMQDLHLTYVQASRAKELTRFYVDRREAGESLTRLADAMKRDREKKLAHDESVEEKPAIRYKQGF